MRGVPPLRPPPPGWPQSPITIESGPFTNKVVHASRLQNPEHSGFGFEKTTLKEIRNPNIEIRNKREIEKSKCSILREADFRFALNSRHSDFDADHS